MEVNRIIISDALTGLRSLPDESVNCCVTSPPYWGLRDYGTAKWEGGNPECDHLNGPLASTKSTLQGYTGEHVKLAVGGMPYRDICGKCGAIRVDSQLGLEKTPEEYVARMVEVFREVRRVLKPEGSLWLNLGSSYASGDTLASQSRQQKHVPACDTDGKESQDFQGAGRACPGLYDEQKDAIPNHHDCTVHNGLCDGQDEPQISRKAHDSERPGFCQESLRSLKPCAEESTTPQSSFQLQDVSSPSATALAFPKENQTFSLYAPEFVRMAESMTGKSLHLPTLVFRKQGNKSFVSACGSPNCQGLGRCGLCWCNITIPFLNVKAKDELNIPHLVAMALQADGWYLRQTIVWKKPNPMPESVTDRPTKAHEYIFLLTKSARYYYDAEAIKEKTVRQGDIQTFGGEKARNGNIPADDPRFRNGSEQWGRTIETGETRNRRSVWEVATAPFGGLHFATFPPKLIEPCILAGCPAGGVVLDPFGGSGTTGMVARILNRNYILIELNPEYAAMARQRIASPVNIDFREVKSDEAQTHLFEEAS